MATDYDDLIAQIDAVTDTTPASTAEPQTPFRFRDTSSESAMDTLRSSGQNNLNALMAITKDPAAAMKAVGALFTKDGISALGDFYKQSYGSPEAALATAKKDPVGFLSDIAMIGTPMRVTGAAANLPKLSQAGAVVENLAPSVGMVAGARTGLANVASSIPATNPEQIYENLLKMPVTPTSRYRNKAVRSGVIDTLLKNKVSPTGRGVDKLNTRVGKLTGELDAIIDRADAQGAKIPARDMYQGLLDMRSELKGLPGYPEKADEIAQIEKYLGEWVKSTDGKREFAPSEMRSIRQKIDKKINWNNVPSSEPPMKQQIRKEAAHGTRGALADAVPDARTVTSEISSLLDAAEPLERASTRLSNNNQTPLQNMLGSTGGLGIYAGGALADSTALQVIGLIQVGKHLAWTPQNKARVAQLIYNDRELSNTVKNNAVRMLYSQGSRQADQVDQQLSAEQ